MKIKRLHIIARVWICAILSSPCAAKVPPYIENALSYFEILDIDSAESGVIRTRLSEIFARYKSTSEVLRNVEKWNKGRHIVPVVYQSEELDAVSFEFYYPSNEDTLTVRVTVQFDENGLELVGYEIGATTKRLWQIVQDLKLSTELAPWGYREKTE